MFHIEDMPYKIVYPSGNYFGRKTVFSKTKRDKMLKKGQLKTVYCFALTNRQEEKKVITIGQWIPQMKICRYRVLYTLKATEKSHCDEVSSSCYTVAMASWETM